MTYCPYLAHLVFVRCKIFACPNFRDQLGAERGMALQIGDGSATEAAPVGGTAVFDFLLNIVVEP